MRVIKQLSLLVLFVLITLPRVLNLGTFMTSDEYLWVSRSRNFMLALLESDWSSTFQTGHPGVTTMWSGTLGLWASSHFVTEMTRLENLDHIRWCTFSSELLPFVRLPIVMVTMVCIAISSGLVYKLFGRGVALVSLILLALDPIYLANARSLHHDALVASFMLVSALSILLYANRSFLYLLLSGVAAGLAFLSKSTSFFLIPFVGLSLVVMVLRERKARTMMIAALAWFAFAGLTFYDFWPAMWVKPLRVLYRVKEMTQIYAQNPHAQGLFFLGEPVQDPGLAYYGLTILFVMTPLTMIGLLVALAYPLLWLWQQKASTDHKSRRNGQAQFERLTLLLFYAVGFILFLGLGAKKQGRYLLPALLMIDVIAAWGLCSLGVWANKRWSRLSQQGSRGYLLGLMLVLLGQATVSLPHHPYYLTYYNPLLGGGGVASRVLSVGWGEGLDVAARYLNSKPDAERLQVATWLAASFAPYFRGTTVSYAPQASDYVILYLSEIQRGIPDPYLQDYIRTEGVLEKIIRLRGIDYAWIYRMPAITPLIPSQNEWAKPTNIYGYQVTPKEVYPSDKLTMTLYLRDAVDTPLTIRMLDERGDVGFAYTISEGSSHNRDEVETRSAKHIRKVLYNFKVPHSIRAGLYCPQLAIPEEWGISAEPKTTDSQMCGQYQLSRERNCVLIRSPKE